VKLYPWEIIDGFKRFCYFHNFNNLILDGIDDEPLYKGDSFIVLAETDLANIVKKSREQNLKLGQDVGIISYNETPLKEIFCRRNYHNLDRFCSYGKIYRGANPRKRR